MATAGIDIGSLTGTSHTSALPVGDGGTSQA